MEHPNYSPHHHISQREVVYVLTTTIVSLLLYLAWVETSNKRERYEVRTNALTQLDSMEKMLGSSLLRISNSLDVQATSNGDLRQSVMELRSQLESNRVENRSLRIAVLELLKREKIIPMIDD